MLISKAYKPWLTCAGPKEIGRDEIKNCYLDVTLKLLISTNGKILSKLPVTVEDGDVSGLIPQEALKEAAKVFKNLPDSRLDCTSSESVKLLDNRTFPRMTATYPNWAQVVPDYSGNKTPTVRLCLNPTLLQALFSAMGAPEKTGVTLSFPIDHEWDAQGKPITVAVGGEILGVIMPISFGRGGRWPARTDDVEVDHTQALAGYGRLLDLAAAHDEALKKHIIDSVEAL